MSQFCNPFVGNLFKRACGLVRGGIQGEIYMANLSEVDNITVANGIVTAITMKTNPTTTNPYFWYRIIPKKNTAGFDNVVVKGTNSKFFNQTLDFAVEGTDTENKLAFESMIDGQGVFIFKDYYGISHMMGHVSGAEVQDGARLGSGIENDSLVGSEVQFLAEEVFVMPTVAVGTDITVLNVDGTTEDTVTIS